MVYRAPDNQDEGDLHTGTRICRKCGERKPMDGFHWAASRKHRARACKSCVHARQAILVAERKRRGDPTLSADRLRREYGLTPEAVEIMFREQHGACAICRNPFQQESRGERMHIDHCHESGHVRALLCHNCNIGLGHFHDSEELMLRGAAYLAQHRIRISALGVPQRRDLTPEERKDRRSATALRQHRSEEGQAALQKRSVAFRGEINHASRLREGDVVAIRAAYALGGTSLRKLAVEYGVTPSNISFIVRRKTWIHV